MGSTQPREYNWGATWQKSSGSCLENRECGRRDPSRWPRGTLYPQKLAISSPTSGGRSVGIVRSRTQTMEFSFSFFRRNSMNILKVIQLVLDVVLPVTACVPLLVRTFRCSHQLGSSMYLAIYLFG
jgi:hypothetical protein